MVKARDLRFDGIFLGMIRQRAKFTFRELARRSQTTSGHIHAIENGKADPSFSLAVDISEAMGLNVSYFVIPTPG